LSTETSHRYTVKLVVVMRISSRSCPLKQTKVQSKIGCGHEEMEEALFAERSHRYTVKCFMVMRILRILKQAIGTQ